MADDKYNDEYEFADLDVINPDSLDEGAVDSSETQQQEGGKTNVRRNALIVVGLIVLAMLGYKFLGSFFQSKGASEDVSVPPISAMAPQPQSQPSPLSQAPLPSAPQPAAPVEQAVIPTPPPPPPPVGVDTTQINQKLSALETSQQNVRSEVGSVSNQLDGINNNVNELSEKIASLNQMISTLSARLEQQSSEIAVLTARTRPKPAPRVISRRPVGPAYYIQAIIPGRAWLIAANGSTLTVREGTQISGYGVVKLIDPNQGRVVTSSGQIIRFSPQDS